MDTMACWESMESWELDKGYIDEGLKSDLHIHFQCEVGLKFLERLTIFKHVFELSNLRSLNSRVCSPIELCSVSVY